MNTPSEYQDLTFEQLLIYYAAKGLTLNLETFKENLSLLAEDGRYNIMAQLLSDNSHMPIRVAIFSGITKGANLYSVREFGFKCLLYSLDEVLRYGDVLNIIQADERDRIVERKEVPLFEAGVHFDFVHCTFRWNSELNSKAHVPCVIVGFSTALNLKDRVIYTDGRPNIVKNINGYLLDADSVFIESRIKPL